MWGRGYWGAVYWGEEYWPTGTTAPAPAPEPVPSTIGGAGLRKRRRRYPVIVDQVAEQGERADLPASPAVGASPGTPDVAPPAPAPIHPKPFPVVAGAPGPSVSRPAAEARIGGPGEPVTIPWTPDAEIDDDELAVLVATTMFD